MKGPLTEVLDVSSVVPHDFVLRQTTATVIHVRFNFEPLRDFTSKREARDFIERFFHENMPSEASSSFKREMTSGLAAILARI